MKTLSEILAFVRSKSLDFVDFERISDELFTLHCEPSCVTYADITILEGQLGDSLWNLLVLSDLTKTNGFVFDVVVRPSDYVQG